MFLSVNAIVKNDLKIYKLHEIHISLKQNVKQNYRTLHRIKINSTGKNLRNYHRFPVLSWSHSPFKVRVPERIIQFLHFLKRHTNDRTNIRKSSESKEQRGKKVIWGPSYPTRHSSDKEGRGIYVRWTGNRVREKLEYDYEGKTDGRHRETGTVHSP